MRFFIFGLVFFVHLEFCRAQTALEIIERYIDTVSNGDLNNWKKITSIFSEREGFYSQGEFDQTRPNFLPPQTHYIKAYKVFPGKEKIEIYSDSTYRNFLSSVLWLPERRVLEFNNMSPIIKPAAKKGDNEYFMPVWVSEIVSDNQSVKFRGIKKFPIDGISCFEIEVKTKDKMILLYFNIESYLLEYRRFLDGSESKTDSDFSNYTRFSDYKRIEGLLFYTTYYSTMNGQIFHTSRTKRIYLNYPIEDDKFKF